MQARAPPVAAAALAAATLLLACCLAPGAQAARWDYFQLQGANGPSPAPEIGGSEGSAPPPLPPPAPAPGARPSSIALPASGAQAPQPRPPAPEAAGSAGGQPAAELGAADACACTATGVSGGANTSGEARGWVAVEPECLPAIPTSVASRLTVLHSVMLAPTSLRSCWVRPVAAAAGQRRLDVLCQ